MKWNRMLYRSLRLVPIALCLGLGVQLATAQELHEVTVTATRRATVEEVGRDRATNAPIEVTSITRHVDYSDLNLTTNSGAALLQRRVRQAAQDECMELDRMHPQLHREAAMCTHDVVNNAMPQVHAAIAAAHGAGSGN